MILLQQIEQLQKELQNLHMEKILGSEALAEMSDPLGSLHKYGFLFCNFFYNLISFIWVC